MSRCVRQWRHLKQIKRGGGAHIKTGLSSVSDGAFALECPACPHPGRNLPQDWDQAPEDRQYVYLLLSCTKRSNLLPGGCTRISSRSMRIFTSSSKAVGSVIRRLALDGPTSSKTTSIVNTSPKRPPRQRYARVFRFGHHTHVFLRLLAAIPPSMPSIRLTTSPLRTTLPLELLPVYVHDTLSCKRMELVTYNVANGEHGRTPARMHEY